MGLPWWVWVVVALLIVGVLIKSSMNSYRDRLRRELLDYLRERRPDLQVVNESRQSVGLQAADGSDIGVLFLHRLYGEGSRIPDTDQAARHALFDLLLKAVEEGQSTLAFDPERDRARVRLRLVTEDKLRDLRRATQTDIPASPLVEGLFAVIVLDNENSVAYVNGSNLEELGLDLDSALALAIENLAPAFDATMVRSTLDGSTVNVMKSFDSYDASRLLLVPRFLNEGESIVALIPDRDTLVLSPLPADGDWSALRKLARNAAGEPLWRKPLVVTAGGLAPAPE